MDLKDVEWNGGGGGGDGDNDDSNWGNSLLSFLDKQVVVEVVTGIEWAFFEHLQWCCDKQLLR